MSRGRLVAELRRFEETGKKAGENPIGKRREGFNVTYAFADAIKSAFALFCFPHRSMLKFQDSLDQRKNAEHILKVKEIPGNNQITRLIDGIAPGAFDGNFKEGLSLAEESGVLEQYQVLDGVWYLSLEKVRCKHGLHLTKNRETT
jgi:hypothetical protein